MEIRCTNCGGSVQKATVIVERETSFGSYSGGGYAGGQYVNTSGSVKMQSALAQRLSADEPQHSKGVWSLFLLVSLTAAFLPLCVCLGTFQFATNGPNGQDPAAQAVEIASIILVFLAIPAIIVASKMLKKRHRRKVNQWWWSVLDRRYYCYSCGAITNV